MGHSRTGEALRKDGGLFSNENLSAEARCGRMLVKSLPLKISSTWSGMLGMQSFVTVYAEFC